MRWQQPRPRRLIGIHALLGLDEATLVAVPDVVHRGWSAEQVVPPASLEAPKLRATADASGAWQLDWNTVDPEARYVLEQSETPDFSAPSVILAAAGATTYALAPPMQQLESGQVEHEPLGLALCCPNPRDRSGAFPHRGSTRVNFDERRRVKTMTQPKETPSSRPIAAVTAIASAPPTVTRNEARMTGAPPR